MYQFVEFVVIAESDSQFVCGYLHVLAETLAQVGLLLGVVGGLLLFGLRRLVGTDQFLHLAHGEPALQNTLVDSELLLG